MYNLLFSCFKMPVIYFTICKVLEDGQFYMLNKSKRSSRQESWSYIGEGEDLLLHVSYITRPFEFPALTTKLVSMEKA